MGTFFSSILFAILLALSVGMNKLVPCSSPQYIKFSTTDTLECNFDENFDTVLWYNSTDYSNSEPIFYFKEGVKSGIGYTSGEFDISEDGSLIIRNVSLSHDHYFTVIKLNNAKDDIIPHAVLAVVTVTPETRFPVIEKCGIHSSTCFAEVEELENISCFVRGARPAVSLQWMARTDHGDTNITSYGKVYNNGDTFSSFATVINIFNGLSDAVLLVCKSTYHSSLLSLQESMIVVENKFRSDKPPRSVHKMVRYKSEMRLFCPKGNSTFSVWKKNSNGVEMPLAIFANQGLANESLFEGYRVDIDGSLIVPVTELEHEGSYTCLYGNNLAHRIENYTVTIYVQPVPPHPIVDGCDHQNYCTLERESEGYLTCRLLGIRPEVQLDWNTVPIALSSQITFSDHTREINHKGFLSNVSVTSKYRLNDMSQNRMTVECKSLKTNVFELEYATKMDLFFLDNQEQMLTVTTSVDERKLTYDYKKWVIPLAFICVMMLLALIGYKKVKGRVQKHPKRQKMEKEETVLMFEDSVTTKIHPDKKQLFIKELKAKYEEMYAAVQPMPFIRDKLFGINEVFVEGGIEFLSSTKGKFGNKVWERLESYSDIFTDPRIQCKRYILEGGPGYGKSTMALQLAHDWCYDTQLSKMGYFEIFILLRLRQMSQKMSITQAIKHLILPVDSQLSENQVQSILHSCTSALVVLDGYDEISNDGNEINTDVKNMIKRELFQNFVVVLTTRSSCIPDSYAPQTKRLRLTGFDANAQDAYISKSVVGNNVEDCNIVKERLRENPVLSDLCQVPLFFVMFAHLTHERQELKCFASVTTFFRYIISCIHAHMSQKFEQTSKKESSLEIDHSKLDKLAFDSLLERSRQTTWMHDEMLTKVGNECFENYVKLGILNIERVLYVEDKPGVSELGHIRYIEEVRFFHELFGEWFAAHHLSHTWAESSEEDFHKHMKYLNPFQCQYVLRFTCGLNPDAGAQLIQYLKHINVSDEIIILCIIEQSGNYGNILDTVKDLCSRPIEIRRRDSRMMQRATLQLLEIAFRNQVNVSCLRFWNCFSQPTSISENIEANSRILPPMLKGIIHVEVYENGRKLESQDVDEILEYVTKCEELKSVKFFDCLMPLSFKSCKTYVEVLWYTRSGEWYIFNTSMKKWRMDVGSGKEAKYASYLSESQYEEIMNLH